MRMEWRKLGSELRGNCVQNVLQPRDQPARLTRCTTHPLQVSGTAQVYIAVEARPDLVLIVRRKDSSGAPVRPAQRMTLKTFKCERCHGFKQSVARRKGLLEHTILPLFSIRPYRCGECGDRYETFGFWSHRIVFRQHTTYVARWAMIVILSASVVAGLVAMLILR
jgi:hypothetical protein